MIRAENHKVELRRRMVKYAEAHTISEAARHFETTRKTVRKWLRRSRRGEGLQDRSKRPHASPSQTGPHAKEKVVELRKKTGRGPHHLSDLLRRTEDIELSPWTIRHIIEREGLVDQKQKQNTCYPAYWAWDTGEPFAHVQADLKDVHDKKTLGTRRTTHLSRRGLPRYQWTFLESRTRLRFLAYSHRKTLTCGLAFLVLCMEWLHSWPIELPDSVQIQTDWGDEFGGDNPRKIARLNRRHFQPRGARLCRYPKGRKGYNGRVERLHRSDDEEFYMPLLLKINDTTQYLDRAFRWQAFYNLYRPHHGHDMNRRTPLEQLRAMGADLHDSFALLPPVLLESVTSDIIHQGGYDVLAKDILPYNATPFSGPAAGCFLSGARAVQ